MAKIQLVKYIWNKKSRRVSYSTNGFQAHFSIYDDLILQTIYGFVNILDEKNLLITVMIFLKKSYYIDLPSKL